MFQKSYRQKSWAVVIMAVEAVEGKDSNIVVLCTFPALMTPPQGHQAGVGNEAALEQNYGRCKGQQTNPKVESLTGDPSHKDGTPKDYILHVKVSQKSILSSSFTSTLSGTEGKLPIWNLVLSIPWSFNNHNLALT